MDTRLFLVRVWRRTNERGGTDFRASVRQADSERAELFTQPHEVTHYLVEHSGTADPVSSTPEERSP